MKRKTLAFCWCLMVWPLLGAAPVSEIQAILARPKILCGRFDQIKQLAGLKNPLRSNGRFCVVADKGVLWRSLQPFANTLRLTRDEIVQWQGERLAMRLNAKQEPTVRIINSLLFSVLAGDLGQLEKHFDVDGSVSDGAWSVKLKARDAGVAKVIGAIALDGAAYVKNIAIDEANGDRTRIVFSALQTGAQAMTGEEAALF
ncbi:MAG: outer membrane lipoprotein carrier protein LolA [Candidatus Binatia bacterium]